MVLKAARPFHRPLVVPEGRPEVDPASGEAEEAGMCNSDNWRESLAARPLVEAAHP